MIMKLRENSHLRFMKISAIASNSGDVKDKQAQIGSQAPEISLFFKEDTLYLYILKAYAGGNISGSKTSENKLFEINSQFCKKFSHLGISVSMQIKGLNFHAGKWSLSNQIGSTSNLPLSKSGI